MADNVHEMSLVPVRVEDDKPKAYCRHGRFVVDAGERTCRCGLCNREVDPYVALRSLAESWETWKKRREHAKAQAQAAEQRLRELLKDEKNAKARIRRAKSRSNPINPPPAAADPDHP